MKVSQVMSPKPQYLESNASIREASLRMQEHDCGFVPIGENDKLVGVVTDRDLALRALADGKSPNDPISSVMNGELLYCYQDDDVSQVLKNMQNQNIQRLAVMNNANEKEFSGVVTLSDIAAQCESDEMAREIASCCQHYH